MWKLFCFECNFNQRKIMLWTQIWPSNVSTRWLSLLDFSIEFAHISLFIFADVKKMPLGKLSKSQIAKGFEALEEIEAALKKKAPKSQLTQLTSKFYTLIPHSFGRKIPPVIDSAETVRAKMDMLLVRIYIIFRKKDSKWMYIIWTFLIRT